MWLVYNDYMDWEEFDFIRKYVRGSDTVFDVGANIGVYTMWLSQFTDRIVPSSRTQRTTAGAWRTSGSLG